MAEGVRIIELENGLLRLRGPALRHSAWGRWWARLWRLPAWVEVELDAIGSSVVRSFGQDSLESLATILARDHRLTRRESEAGVTAFVIMLLKRKLVRLDRPGVGR